MSDKPLSPEAQESFGAFEAHVRFLQSRLADLDRDAAAMGCLPFPASHYMPLARSLCQLERSVFAALSTWPLTKIDVLGDVLTFLQHGRVGLLSVPELIDAVHREELHSN